MITYFSAWAIGFSVGFVGSVHCLFMCGGIAATVTMQPDTASKYQRTFAPVLYSVGRVITYMLLGLLFAYVGGLFGETFAIQHVLLFFANILLIFCGLYLFLLDRSYLWAEAVGHRLWDKISPMAARLMRLQTLPGRFLCGLVWGLLPCSLVYTMMAKSFLDQSWLMGLITMAGFGVGTMPAMLTIGWSGQLIALAHHKRLLYYAGGMLLIGFGLWGIYRQYATISFS